jgi:hypothetical protein
MPPPLDDPVLGRLEWEDEESLFGECEYKPGVRVEIRLWLDPANDDSVPDDIVRRARVCLERFRKREREYRMWTAAQLDEKRHNRDVAMSHEDIANLLRVILLSFSNSGAIGVYWDDDFVLMGGNTLVTEIGPDGECLYAGLR